MILRVREWYGARSAREQRLLLLMLAIALPLFGWLLVVQPLSRAYDRALEEHLEAVDRHGRVLALVERARARPASSRAAAANADLQLVITESASQAGIALQAATLAGSDMVEVRAEGARAPAAGQWLRDLETRGLAVQELRMTPQPDGTINLSARVVRNG